MNNKYLIGGVVLALALSLFAVLTRNSNTPSSVVNTVLGSAGPVFDFPVVVHNGITVGNSRLATTSVGTVTYTAKNIVNSSVIEHIASGTTVLTLPTNAALSSAGFLPIAGDTYTMFIEASTTLVTLAGNTDVILDTASTSAKIYPGQMGRLDFVRLGKTEANRIHVLLTAD